MDLVEIPGNRAPEGAITGAVTTADGVALRYARWPADSGRKGTVCVLQGRTEFVEKYFEVVRDLRARGFAVATFDWRGQGLSARALGDRRKGHVRRFAEYDRDLEAFVRGVVFPDCPPPYFALGHSMGATIVIRAVEQGHRWFDRSVFTSPMISLTGRASSRMARSSALLMTALGMGVSYVPGGGPASVTSVPFEFNMLTSDRTRYERAEAVVQARPELAIGAPTIAWLAAAYGAMATISAPEYPLKLRHPMLIVAAAQDAVVSTAAIEQFAIRLRAGSHLVIAGARHEIMMEHDRYRDQFWAAFDAFVPGSAFSQTSAEEVWSGDFLEAAV